MKDLFDKYFDNKIDLQKDNYNEFIYIFDTNTLLNLYRYSFETSKNFIKILEMLKNNIWIPYHTALEFKNNRDKVINTQIRAFEETKNALNENYSDLKSKIKKLSIENRHPSINVEELSNKYKELLNNSIEVLDNLKSKYKLFLCDDPILQQIMNLFDKRVGPEPTNKEYDEWMKNSSERLKKMIPPGYMVSEKKDFFIHNEIIYEKKYSDYILWFQVIEKIKNDKIKHVVFITDDRKVDWFDNSLLFEKLTLRLELQNDIKHFTSNETFISMSSIDLIQFFSDKKIINVDNKSIKEMIEENKYKHLFEGSNRIPYVLVLYPDENKIAVYDRGYRLISESASTNLINFAIEKHVQKEDFFSFNLPWQQPSWMEKSIKDKCITYWLWNIKPIENFPNW